MIKKLSTRIEYYNDAGQIHREDGPAVIWNDSYKEWVQHNKLHRLDGPAVETVSGNKY